MFDFKNRRVTVMGLGRHGGGVGLVRFFSDRGARVAVTDLLTADDLEESLNAIDDCRVDRMRLGGHDESDFTDVDLVAASPAVPLDNAYLNLARASGAVVTSEINLFWQQNPSRVVGVTGSNGKSTTAAMVHSILEAAGFRSRLGGNIGRSLLPEIDDLRSEDWTVLELSSFQLETLDALFSSPEVAVVTNFTPNHLDRHGSLDAYRRAKQTILRWQTEDGVAVLNAGDPDLAGWCVNGARMQFASICSDLGGNANGKSTTDGVYATDAAVRWVQNRDQHDLNLRAWLRVPGEHNLQNAMAAACAAIAAGADFDAVQRGIQDYRPLPHRLEFAGEVAGRRFYNDSQATTPESAACALRSFDEPVVLLAGGYDKHIDLGPLAEAAAGRAKTCALMGQTAEILAHLIDEQSVQGAARTRECESFEEAFAWAFEQSEPGDVVLLSPGCASHDWFRDYAERGNRFVELVRNQSAVCDPA